MSYKHMNYNDNLLFNNVIERPLSEVIQDIKNEIIFEGDKPHTNIEEELSILAMLEKFPFGQYLIRNRGLNGYWSDIIISNPQKIYENLLEKNNDISIFIDSVVNQLPSVLARRDSFVIYRNLLQNHLHENITLCSVACGLMRDFLSLDYSDLKLFTLTGLDLDENSLSLAYDLACQYHLIEHCKFHLIDAWKMNFPEKFDIISNHGLNIYVYDDDHVIHLYQNFYHSLKKGGRLISSFLTPPPNKHVETEWNMSAVDPEALRLQRVIFSDILQAKWNAYRSTELTKSQLYKAGFDHIEIYYDQARILPCFVAHKK